MEVRFQDIFQLEVPDWIINPFCDIISENGILMEELVTLKSDLELKPKFKIWYQSFWLQNKIKERHPYVWDRVRLFLIAFTSSYLLECAFSAVILLLDSKKNCPEIVNCGDLRLFLTKLKPNNDELKQNTSLIHPIKSY